MNPSMTMAQLTQQSKPPNDKVALFQQKLVQYLKNSEAPSIEELKRKTGFDEVDLNAIKLELRRPVLTTLAAVEEVFHINEGLRKTLEKQVARRIKEEKTR